MDFIYELSHSCAEDVQYVATNMEPEEFDLLLAYIQFEGEDVEDLYPLIPIDMANDLLPLYGCKKVEPQEIEDDDFEIDLTWNRERNCGKAFEIQAMEKFHNPKLKPALVKVFEKIIAENSKVWRD